MYYGKENPLLKYKKKRPEFAFFNGIDGSINFGNVHNFSTGNFSIYIKFKGQTSTGPLIHKLTTMGYDVIYDYNAGNPKIISNIKDNDAHSATIEAPNISANTIYQLLITYDKASNMILYLDDDVIDTVDISAIGSTDNITDFVNGISSKGNFLGNIYDFALWNDVLTPTEVTAANNGFLQTDNLIAHYPHNSLAENTWQDYSGEDNDGTYSNIQLDNIYTEIELKNINRNSTKEEYPKPEYFTNVLGDLVYSHTSGHFKAEYTLGYITQTEIAELLSLYNSNTLILLFPNKDNMLISYTVKIIDFKPEYLNGFVYDLQTTIKFESINTIDKMPNTLLQPDGFPIINGMGMQQININE